MTLTVLSLWLLLSVLCFVFKLTFIGGSEWGYLDKTKHFDFWLCNMKQLIFMHFNTNSKKFTLTVIFFLERNKNGSQNAKITLFSISRSFQPFLTFPDETTEDPRRLPKIFEEKSENFRLYFRRYIHM